MKRRILIGSCGGLTGSYLVRQFKRRKNCIIVAADMSERNVTRHFADEFIVLPDARDPLFFEQLVQQLYERKIDYYIPTHSAEIREISRREGDLRSVWSGGFIVSPYETFLQLDQKQEANKNLRKIGIPVPRLLEKTVSENQYPIFMKPNEGSGGQRALVIENAVLHREYARLYPSNGFYEMLLGTEYTVDCLFDREGKLLGYNQRIRRKSQGGAAIVTQNDNRLDISQYLIKIAQNFIIKGCVNFQYILCDGVPYFIDVNLRCAAGGLPLTVASGFDIPEILLELLAGKVVKPVNLRDRVDGRTMYRYYEEWYEDETL